MKGTLINGISFQTKHFVAMPKDEAVKAIIDEVKGIQKAGVPVDIGDTEEAQQSWAESAYTAMKETERKHKEKEAAAIAKAEAGAESKQ